MGCNLSLHARSPWTRCLKISIMYPQMLYTVCSRGVCLGYVWSESWEKQHFLTCLPGVITGFSVGPGWISRKPNSRGSLQLLCSCWRPVCSGWSTATRYLLSTRESSSLCWLWQWKGVSLGSGLLFFLNSFFAGFERRVKCSFNFVFDEQFITTCR